MTRAFAETVWLAAQPDPLAAWITIEQVFGWAPHSNDHKRWMPPASGNGPKSDAASIGSVVFHDAWPTHWPKLMLDIVNNHHRGYYEKLMTSNESPPGDWEKPNIVSFLAVPSQTEFEFAVSLRSDSADSQTADLVLAWLAGALELEGAGAKTAAGYGRFDFSKKSAITQATKRAKAIRYDVGTCLSGVPGRSESVRRRL